MYSSLSSSHVSYSALPQDLQTFCYFTWNITSSLSPTWLILQVSIYMIVSQIDLSSPYPWLIYIFLFKSLPHSLFTFLITYSIFGTHGQYVLVNENLNFIFQINQLFFLWSYAMMRQSHAFIPLLITRKLKS